ncbi:MAG: flagellar motor switch protein FliN [Rhizobiaceae bacterium]|nr:flagellar motor switch protein FliN [Rhizobiaceae bacterium]MCV0409185.1 flagellar motor switch protein FliN [Rhizobiaceae bacterium]
MTKAGAAAAAEPQPDELNKAIEELRGVLHDGEDGSAPDEAAAAAHSGAAQPTHGARNPNVIMDIPVDVQIILGSTEMSVSQLMALQKGSTVALDRRIGEPVDIMVNGRKIARGEITVLEEDPSRFGIRLTEIVAGAKA